ncbi:unnamed protein product [Sympodiomycopsis kandeliae]
MSDDEMRRSRSVDRERDDDMEVDYDDPNINRKGRGFTIRGGASNKDAEMDGVRSRNFDRLDIEEQESIKAVKSVEGWIILVTNIHEEASEEEVLDKFADFGQVKSCHLNLDRRTGYAKGYALLEYEHYDDAKDAVDTCSSEEGLALMEQNLQADFAFVKPPHQQNQNGRSVRGVASRDHRARSPDRR